VCVCVCVCVCVIMEKARAVATLSNRARPIEQGLLFGEIDSGSS
jgi:hypothetical protein